MRRITIIIDDKHGFDVEEDGKTCGGLGWDEMLGQIAMLTIPVSRVGKGFEMKTPAEWEGHWDKCYKHRPPQAIPPLLIAGPDTP